MDITKFYYTEGERPLDAIKADGGFFGIFRTVACVGDSLSSGEFESTDEAGNKGYHDYYEYSWGQYMARAAGSKVYNFSRGGMSAKWYLNSFGDENDLWNPEKAAQAYVFALGVNDLYGMNQELGEVGDEDCAELPDTFAAYYGKLIKRYKEISPEGYFFLMTMPSDGEKEKKKAHRELLYKFAEKYPRTYVLDLFEYAPEYDEKFKQNFYLGGHLNPMGYMLTAQMVMSYIDWLIRKNPEDFLQAGFTNKGVHNRTAKWEI